MTTAFVAALAAGCSSGNIQDPSAEEPPGSAGSPGETPNPDPGPGPTPNPDPTPNPQPPPVSANCADAAVPVDQPRRLNITELNTVAADVLNIGDDPFAMVGNDYGERVGVFLGLSERFLTEYFDAAEALAQRYVAQANLGADCTGDPTPPPSGDECNTTAECREIHGNAATDCVNSASDQSYCACGNERCTAAPDPSPSAGATAECAGEALRPLAEKLFRRPVTDAQLTKFAGFAESAVGLGLSFEDGLAAGLTAILMSPDFLMVGTDAEAVAGPQALDGYARAERLALALWDSVPDDALLEAARTGVLDTDEGLRAQVNRMLADPEKGQRFLDGFIETHFDLPSGNSVPLGLEGFGADAAQLAADMRREAELLIQAAFDGNLSVDRLVQGTTTFVNERLANYYGVPGVTGEQFVQVSTEGTPRVGGLLTTGAVLAQEGDIIHRGVNVLQGYLCQSFVPPDPDVIAAALARLPDNATVREQVEFRKDDGCRGCHAFIDPLGAAFEGFDESGQPRDQYPNGDSVVYDSTYLGQPVSTPADVTKIVLESQFRRCVSSQILGWVSFRRLLVGNKDARCASDSLLTRVGSEAGLQDLVVEAFLTDTFKNRVVDQ